MGRHKLHQSLQRWIILAQKCAFLEHIVLKQRKELSIHSNLRCLSPFLDNEGVSRGDDRLKNTSFSQDRKHPLLLQKRYRLTELILLQEHFNRLHAGTQLMLATLQRRYWIIGGRDLVRQFVTKCVTYYRHHHVTPQIANLPAWEKDKGYPPANASHEHITSGSRYTYLQIYLQ
jgi:hypothetical protein